MALGHSRPFAGSLHRATVCRELFEQRLPSRVRREDDGRVEEIVEFLWVSRIGGDLGTDFVDHRLIDQREVACLDRDAAAQRHRARAALLQGRVVQERVRTSVQDLVGEDRWLRCVAGDTGNPLVTQAREQ